ncbi:MAG: VOC family protein [Planctomycetota bacterium]|jgi:catechol 2,3-dioxygenase-like lactoylglutathione lyase family enzyme
MTHSILPRPSLFSVELRTARWPTLVDWYRDALGLKVLVRVLDDEYALLEAGDTRLAILGRASAGEASGRWSLGFEVPDVVVARERLLGMAMTVGEPTIHPEGFHELRVVDPDGNRLRLFAWALGHHA